MTLRRIAFGPCAGALAAQTFIQMADPQFGIYSKNQGFEHDTANFEFAIATANHCSRLSLARPLAALRGRRAHTSG